MKKNRLAIVIPAYKALFLDQTLNSLINQTCQDFTVYIGDDNSPYQLKEIVDRYVDRLDIVYCRFLENYGGKNLISQWLRCVKLIREEEFFCLFSDDDLMGADNIKQFYEMLEQGNDRFDVYHFDIDIIDDSGVLLKECAKFPSLLTSSGFFYMLYMDRIDARIPEFIFRTSHFWEHDGYVDFDMGYTSDNATVMVCAEEKGIFSVPNTKVLWRDSGLNLSSDKDLGFTRRRIRALVHFLNWTDLFFSRQAISYPLSLRRKVKLITRNLKNLYPAVGIGELCRDLKLLHPLSGNYFLYLYFKSRFVWRLLRDKTHS